MGISEIVTAIGAVGISSIILALVKLMQFFRDENKEKVSDILSRVDDDNKRWHTKYEDTLTELELTKIELERVKLVNTRLKVELIMTGVPEDKVTRIENEASN